MNFLTKELSSSQNYHLLVQAIIPRPIAWVLTKNNNNSLNLSPFSYFNAVSNKPPMVMLSVGYKKDGQKKDTWKNIEREEEFVVHLPSTMDAKEVSKSSYEYDVGESEVTKLNLKTQNRFKLTELPVLENSKLAFYCELIEIINVEKSDQGIIFGEIKEYFLDDHIVKRDGEIVSVDVKELNPMGRLGGNDFVSLGETMTVERPKEREK